MTDFMDWLSIRIILFKKKAKKLMGLINEVLKGRYVYNNGIELLYIPDENNSATLERYVKINFTSSGQQESV